MKLIKVSLRHFYDFKEYTIETYKLKIQQDGEIEKIQKKEKFVALMVNEKGTKKDYGQEECNMCV